MIKSAIGLQIEGLTIRQKNLTILDHLSLHLEAGSLTGLIGPSGAGKTTLLRTLGLRPPSKKNKDLGIVTGEGQCFFKDLTDFGVIREKILLRDIG